MAKSKTPDRSNTGRRGARKTRLSRLELFLMGQGPTVAVQRKMVKESLKGGPKASK